MKKTDIRISFQHNTMDEKEQMDLENYLSEKFNKLKKYLDLQSKKNIEILVNAGKSGKDYSLSCILNISRLIYIHVKGSDIKLVVDELYENFKKRIMLQRHLEKKDYQQKKKIRQESQLSDVLPDLTNHREEENRLAFNHLFQNSIHNIKDYIRRRLKEEYLGNDISSKSEFKENELLDELYLEIWSNFDKKPDDSRLISEWIFHIADKFIGKKLKNPSARSVSLEEFVESERELLEERITVDAEGELYLEEDLLETGYKKNYYKYQDFFPDEILIDQYEIENYNDFIQEFDNKVFELLSSLPFDIRTIFDLYFVEGMTIMEISRIKKKDEKTIGKNIKQVNNFLIKELRRWLGKNYNLIP